VRVFLRSPHTESFYPVSTSFTIAYNMSGAQSDPKTTGLVIITDHKNTAESTGTNSFTLHTTKIEGATYTYEATTDNSIPAFDASNLTITWGTAPSLSSANFVGTIGPFTIDLSIDNGNILVKGSLASKVDTKAVSGNGTWTAV